MPKNDIDMQVGKRLRQRRTMLGLSQEALARAVGITFQQVQKYEKGANAMNATRLCEFAKFLHVPVAYFFDDLEAAKGHAAGFAEEGEKFEHAHRASDRESLEMMKAFKRISQQSIRKRITDMVRAIADNQAVMD
ncbi:MAG: helix-turn-helix transcriptional regulator [Pseudomonadota bacterium]|nr:helix-turn-helix transcriptional regulator [Pseudomonadota bacterium]